MNKQVIIEYDTNKYNKVDTTDRHGNRVISLQKKYYRCDCCGTKVTKENWGGYILKPRYRDKVNVVIYKQDQKDFVCNVCLRPDVRETMRLLGLGNRK